MLLRCYLFLSGIIFSQAFEAKPPGGGNTAAAQLCQATKQLRGRIKERQTI